MARAPLASLHYPYCAPAAPLLSPFLHPLLPSALLLPPPSCLPSRRLHVVPGTPGNRIASPGSHGLLSPPLTTWGGGQTYGHMSLPTCRPSAPGLHETRGWTCDLVPVQPGPSVSDKRVLRGLLRPPVPALPRECRGHLLWKRDLLRRSQRHGRL